MISVVVGPVIDDNNQVSELLSDLLDCQEVDMLQMFRELSQNFGKSLSTRIVNFMPINDNFKRLYIHMLENEANRVVILGNLIFNDSMLDWVASKGGNIFVVSRNKLSDYPKDVIESTRKYYADKEMQRYELETRWKATYERLNKKFKGVVHLLDLSKDTFTDDFEEIIGNIGEENESKQVNPNKVLKTITDKWVEDEEMGMSIEESIQKAMMALGMEDDVVSPVNTKEEQTEKPVKKSVKKEIKKQSEPIMNEPEIEDDEVPESIFCKISDGTMALLIPEGLTLEKESIGDMRFNVATVSIPDFTSKKLQELSLHIQSKTPEVSEPEKPVKEVKKVEKPVNEVKEGHKNTEKPHNKTNISSNNLDDLTVEKARLDKEIKEAREERDLELVEQLRKQRRAVRKKINDVKRMVSEV